MSIVAFSKPAALALAGLLLATAPGVAGPADDPARSVAGPLGLREAIAEALRNSPTLRPAADRVALADLGQRVAESRFGLKISPSVGAGLASMGPGQRGAGVEVSKRLTAGTDLRFSADLRRYGAGGLDVRDAGYSFTISQPLLQAFGPVASAELRDAERAVVSSARTLENARQRLVLDVAAAFYAIVRQQRLVDAGERALERAAILRRTSEARTKVGLATRLDVLRAELLASQAEVHLATQREALAESVDRLKVLVGRPVEAPLEIAADARLGLAGGSDFRLPTSAPPSLGVRRSASREGGQGYGGSAEARGEGEKAEATAADAAAGGTEIKDVEGIVVLARATRLELSEARDRVADAERHASIARWNLLPDLSLNASYTRRGLGSATTAVLNDLFGGWRLAVTTSYRLDRTVEASAAERAGIAVGAERRALADLEQQVAAEVRRAWRARARAAATVEIQAKAVEIARQQLRLSQLRYERGLAGNFDVVDAEANVFAAESGLIAAEVEAALAALALEHAAGTLDPARYHP